MTVRRSVLFSIGLIVLIGLFVGLFVAYKFSQVEVIFDVNRLDVDNVASHPDITNLQFSPDGTAFTFRTLSGTPGSYYPDIPNVVVGCLMREEYQTFRSLGFTYWQILTARRFEPNRYRVKVGRIYEVNFSRFEQSQGHGRGIDDAAILWK